jgi:histidine ammonia-lyase
VSNIEIGLSTLDLATLRRCWESVVKVEVNGEVREVVQASARAVNKVLADGRTVYGLNTGFGQLANVHIDQRDLEKLQDNLIKSHAVGVGKDLDEDSVRLLMICKLVGLTRGVSGVTTELVDQLAAVINAEIYPCIPEKGSVGASGDLAPLAHMAGTLLGYGEVRRHGKRLPAADALAEVGLKPIRLRPKEGLALLNGTQVSTTLALAAAFRTENILSAALVSGALAVDAIKGSDTPFDPRIQAVRGQAGQVDIARMLRKLLAESEIRLSHEECGKVQDPYSIRCQPQVVGACLDVLRHVMSVLQVEANAVTDNPLVFAADDEILSGGNFHAEPVAFAADYLALAIAELGAMSERRLALMTDANLSGLPAFLVKEGGLNSGFMMAQVTAAALASENKSLAHPASVDSLPTSANQEDHVSMATYAGLRLHTMLDNVANIIAIELLAAVQGVEFHRPVQTSPLLDKAIQAIRRLSAPYVEDRSLSPDIRTVAEFINAGGLLEYTREILPSQS